MKIEEKIENIVRRGILKRNRRIEDLSKIGLSKPEYSEYLNYITNNGNVFDSIYRNVPIFQSNSPGQSRAYFKISDCNKSIGIIGTSGKGDDVHRLGIHYWNVMLDISAKMIENTASNIFISRGFAWADHIAIEIFLKNRRMFNLVLYLPCSFINGKFDESTEIGKYLNSTHRQQSEKLGVDTLSNIRKSIEHGCEVKQTDCDIDRMNLMCDESNILLGFTFGDGRDLACGEEKEIFDNFLKKKNRGLGFHYNLNDERMFTY